MDGGFKTGRVDLVFRENGGLVVVDWKTDSVGLMGVAGAAEAHRPQVEMYCSALAAASGVVVREAVLVFPRARQERMLGCTT